MKEAWGWIRDIAIAVVIAAVLLFFFKPIIIQQESMQPNFYSKDYVIVSKQAYKLFGAISSSLSPLCLMTTASPSISSRG